jgi:hypothetical protein
MAFSHPPVPDNLKVEDSVFYLDGEEISEDHADYLAGSYGFIDEDDKSGLEHLEAFLKTRQHNA